MGKLVVPEVFLIGYTTMDDVGLREYLEATGNQEFNHSIEQGVIEGLSLGEILCSFYAKLCYKSLTLGQNKNVNKVRDIKSNLENCFDQGHGSVFEHCQLNFVITNCSRVFTHELVRHRVGTAFSQTSGRYVRGDRVDIVFDPILEPVRELVIKAQEQIEKIYNELTTAMGLNGREALRILTTHYTLNNIWAEKINPWAHGIPPTDEDLDRYAREQLGINDLDNVDFDKKKKITSALRRILPNGQVNEIGLSLNVRSLRHIIQVRTARGAEWEIRYVFDKVYRLIKAKFPLMFYGATESEIEGLIEVGGMKTQPYQSF